MPALLGANQASLWFPSVLRVVASKSSINESTSCVDSDSSLVASNNVVYTRVDVWTPENHLSHLFSISHSDPNRDSQFTEQSFVGLRLHLLQDMGLVR